MFTKCVGEKIKRRSTFDEDIVMARV